MFRALRPAFKSPDKRELSSLFLYAAVAIPVFYLPALFYGPHTNFAVIDNWRFWIIHLWVEGFFELFATVLVAIMFHQMGVVSTKTATRLIYLDAILYLSGGIIGTGHHWYFTGQGTLNMGLASCFSALEVVPLTLLTLDAWDFIKLRKEQCSACGHDLAWSQKWSIYFLMAVGVWNFVGAGGLRFPDQPADRVLLRGGHVAHRQSRTRRTVWCLWDVGLSGPGLLLEGHAIRHRVEGDGEVRPGGLLGC
jgi:nitric oxide reductase subunit B